MTPYRSLPAGDHHSIICVSQTGQSAADTGHTFAQENVSGMSYLLICDLAE